MPDFQLSLAIGKEGQNARLAARLTGWRIDIRSDADPRSGVRSARVGSVGSTHGSRQAPRRCGRRDPPYAGEHDAGADHRDAALHSDPAHDLGAALTVRLRSGPCVGCRARSPADGLLRVVAVDGVLSPDPRRRLPGRGAWLHPDPECLHRAERRWAFLRALRVPGPLGQLTLVRRHLHPTRSGETAPRLDRGREQGRPVMSQS